MSEAQIFDLLCKEAQAMFAQALREFRQKDQKLFKAVIKALDEDRGRPMIVVELFPPAVRCSLAGFLEDRDQEVCLYEVRPAPRDPRDRPN